MRRFYTLPNRSRKSAFSLSSDISPPRDSRSSVSRVCGNYGLAEGPHVITDNQGCYAADHVGELTELSDHTVKSVPRHGFASGVRYGGRDSCSLKVKWPVSLRLFSIARLRQLCRYLAPEYQSKLLAYLKKQTFPSSDSFGVLARRLDRLPAYLGFGRAL